MITRTHTKAVRILQFFFLCLARVGVVQVFEMSAKGRLTQFVERIEPFIRRKFVRFKWFPPVLVAVHLTESPNVAVEEHFARQVVFVTSSSSGLLAAGLRWKNQGLDVATMKPFQYLKRPGSPWEFAPSVRSAMIGPMR